MTWAEYYERYDEWQESTQYSRLASITDFGPDGSPSEEICDCIQYVDTRTAASILRRALAAGVRFRAAEVTEIADSGQIEDEKVLNKLIQTTVDSYSGEQLSTLLECFMNPEPVYNLMDKMTSKPTHFTESEILALLPDEPDEPDLPDEPDKPDKKILLGGKKRKKKTPGWFSSILIGMAAADRPEPESTGKCTGDCENCPPHYGYRYGRWYYGHGHIHGCEFCGNGGYSGKCNRD